MNSIRTLRLNIALPLLVIGSFSLLLLFSVFYLHRQILGQIEQNAFEDARQLLANTELKIETLTRHNQPTLIAEEITEHGALIHVNALVLIDDRGYIIQSTRLEWIARYYQDVIGYFNPRQVNSVLNGQSSIIEFDAEKNHLMGYQPVTLAMEQNHIRSTRIGVLLLDYDISGDKAASWDNLIQAIYPILLFGIILILLTSIIIRQWVERPIRHLTDVVTHFAQGNYQSATRLTGNGELMVLSDAWNQMSQQLAETIRQLEVSKEQYAVTLLSIGDAVIATDIQNRITFMNKVAENLTGWKLSEVSGQPLEHAFNIFNATNLKPAESPVKGALETGKIIGLKNHTLLLNRQGKHKQIADSAAPIKTQSGETVGVVLVFRDITEEYNLKESLVNERALLRCLIDAVPDLIFYKDPDCHYLGCNDAFAQFVHRSEKELIGKSDFELFENKQACFFHSHDQEIFTDKALVSHEEIVFEYPNQSSIIFDTVKTPFYTQDGKLLGLVGISRNITDRKRIEQKLLESEERIRSLGNNLPNGYIYQYQISRTGMPHFTFISAGVEKLHHLKSEEIITAPMLLFNQIDSEHWPIYQHEVKRSARELSDFSMELLIHPQPGIDRWIQVNSRPQHIDNAITWDGVVIDITDNKANEEQIWHQANFDVLTDLPNRRMFLDRLRQEIKKAHRNNAKLAVLFIDLDRFKEINDTLGHDLGDQLLRTASERLQCCVRDSDTVARLGGDEFTIILTDLDLDEQVDRVAELILLKMAEPIYLNEEPSYISASIGITIYPTDSNELMQLIKHADQAMYQAKEMGRNCYSYYTASMQEAAHYRLSLIQDLRSTLIRQQFSVHFQPIIHLQTGEINKAEALIRWNHPTKGEIPPDAFIPLAEEIGLINEISNWVFIETLHQVQKIRRNGKPNFQISINKSPIQFRANHASLNWLAYLDELALPGNCVVIEITEGLLLEASNTTQEKLLAFRNAGIEVALDDFGTGYSALSYLKKFDIDYLKIDQSFVRNLTADSGDMALCEAMIVMAHKLGIQVIAEGIETEQQMQLLLETGCDYGQGFFFSPALPGPSLETYLFDKPQAAKAAV